MHHGPGIDLHLDPLGELEVQRALALARARESYPAVPRETLLGYCEAAWDVALKADPRRRDLQGSFDRALLIIAWTQRRSGGRVPLRELVDQTVPRIALEPFISEPGQPALAEPQPEVRVQPEEPRPARRSPLRVPFTSPIPVGAAVAAGVVGIAVLSETEVLPIAPFQPAGSDNASTDDGVAARDRDGGRAESSSGSASADSGTMVTGLLPSGLPAAARQAVPAAPPPAAVEAAPEAGSAGTAGSAGSKDKLKRQPTAQVAANAVGGGAVAPAAAPAPEESVAVAPAPPAEPVVELEMAPTTMVIEVSAPLSDDEGSEPDETDEGGTDTGAPGSDENGDQVEPQPGEDEDEESGAFDVLVDAPQPDEGDGSEDEGDTDDEALPDPPLPVTPVPTPPVSAPVMPTPVAPAAPGAPAPATPAPTTPAPGAPAPAETAPATTTPAAPAPGAPAPAPAAPAPTPAQAPATPAPAAAAPTPAAPAPAAPAPAPAAPAPAPAAPAPATSAPAPAAPAPAAPAPAPAPAAPAAGSGPAAPPAQP
jgi:resuscitation-promoting factor RpfA